MARKKSPANRQQGRTERNNAEARQPSRSPSAPSSSSSSSRNVRNGPLCLQTDNKQVICKLPREFGKNVWLFSTLNSETKGLRHVIIEHENDFRNEANLCKQLQAVINSENFLGIENNNRYIWEYTDSRGNKRELVTAVDKKGKHYELITAWKRNPAFRGDDDERNRSTESLLSTSASWLSKLFASCFGCCPSNENDEDADEYH